MSFTTGFVKVVLASCLVVSFAACQRTSKPKPIKTNHQDNGLPSVSPNPTASPSITPTASPTASPSASPTVTPPPLGADDVPVTLSDGTIKVIKWKGLEHLDTTGKFKITNQ